jgi:hypothetical protein
LLLWGDHPLSSFTLPNHREIHDTTPRAIAARHGLDATTIVRLPEAGISNAIYQSGQPASNPSPRVPRGHLTLELAMGTSGSGGGAHV